MTRFGKLFAGVLVLALVGFVAILRINPAGEPTAPPPAASEPVMAPPPALDVARGSRLTMPVEGVLPVALAPTFDQARGEERRHEALDIMAPEGTPVLAAAGGTVEKLFASDDGGLTVYVRSPDRRLSYYYAHLRDYAPDLREGNYVAAGDRLGSVGSTGNADPAGPHLHFALFEKSPDAGWNEGRAIDPYPLLAGNPPRR